LSKALHTGELQVFVWMGLQVGYYVMLCSIVSTVGSLVMPSRDSQGQGPSASLVTVPIPTVGMPSKKDHSTGVCNEHTPCLSFSRQKRCDFACCKGTTGWFSLQTLVGLQGSL